MLVQILFIREDQRLAKLDIIRSIKGKGYDIKVFPIEFPTNEQSFKILEDSLRTDAHATIISSGLFWEKLIKRVNPTLLPNSIVGTDNVMVHYSWSINPVHVVFFTRSVFLKILSILQSFSDHKRLYPRPGSFFETDYGWVRRSILEEPISIRAWDELTNNVWPGYQFLTWSFHKGDIGNNFSIKFITPYSITIHSPTAENLQKIPKVDFLKLALYWKDYKSGNVPRSYLRDMTRYSTYIIGILHWLEIEGHLKNVYV